MKIFWREFGKTVHRNRWLVACVASYELGILVGRLEWGWTS